MRSDILPAVALSIGTGVGAYLLNHSQKTFRMSDITIPAIYGVVALIGWLVLSNGAEFAWKFAVAGYKNEIDDLKHPATITKPSATFEGPFKIEDPARKGAALIFRVGFTYESAEDSVQAEAHFAPLLSGREFVNPPMHLERKIVPDPRLGRNPITLRHGQTAFVDLVGVDDKGGEKQLCYAIDLITFSDGERFRDQVTIPPGDYVLTLRLLYSGKPHDEIRYAVRVGDGPEPLTLATK